MKVSIFKHGKLIEERLSDSRDFGRPLFEDGKKILFLDVDGVLIKQVGTYYKGVRGDDVYRIIKDEKKVFEYPKRVVDEVVLWSHTDYRQVIGQKAFREVPYVIIGCFNRNGDGKPYKPMKIASKYSRNIVGVEDNDWFCPRNRVVRVNSSIGPKMAVRMALEML